MGVRARMISKTGTPPYTWGSADYITEFVSETLQKKGSVIHGQGLTGSLDRLIGRARLAQYICAGQVVTELTHDEAIHWIARALGEADGSVAIEPQLTLTDFGVLIDRVANVFEYQTCNVARLGLQGRATAGSGPQPIIMSTDILAVDESISASWPVTPPTLSATDLKRRPLVFSDGTLKVGGTAYGFMGFSLLIDNMLQPRWTNSLTATSFCPAGRRVILRTTTPYTSTEHTPFYANAENLDPATPITGELKFTDGRTTITISFNALQWAQVSPTVKGNQEIPLFTDFIATSTQQVDPPTTSEAEIYVAVAFV